jgi:hypothetical protein
MENMRPLVKRKTKLFFYFLHNGSGDGLVAECNSLSLGAPEEQVGTVTLHPAK